MMSKEFWDSSAGFTHKAIFESAALKEASRALVIQSDYWCDYAKRGVIVGKMLDVSEKPRLPGSVEGMQTWLATNNERIAKERREDWIAGKQEPDWSKKLEDPCVMLNHLTESRGRLEDQLTSLRATSEMLTEGKVLLSLLNRVEEAVRAVSLDGKLSFTGRARWKTRPFASKTGVCPKCKDLEGKIFTAESLPVWPLHPNCVCDVELLDEQGKGGTA
jgi:hypothetical protein